MSVLAPATTRERIAAGRARLRIAEAGDPSGIVAPPGEVVEVAIGRALPAGPGKRVGGPFDLVAALEAALSRPAFDIVAPPRAARAEPRAGGAAPRAGRRRGHLPPRRAARRRGVAAAPGGPGPVAGRPADRDHRRGRRALAEILPGDYQVIPPGRGPGADPGARSRRADRLPPGLVLVARGRDRAGVRFVLGAAAGLDLTTVGPVTLVGPPDAPWRTRAAVPKALRDARDGGARRRARVARRRRWPPGRSP